MITVSLPIATVPEEPAGRIMEGWSGRDQPSLCKIITSEGEKLFHVKVQHTSFFLASMMGL